jgi:tetratricopeptide (TPR) repeat protein
MGELDRILREGAALHDEGRFDDALLLYDDAVGRWPTLALIWNNRGNTLLELGFFDQAEKSYRQALQLAPSLHDSRVALATCLQAQGEMQQALIECAKVLRADHEHAEAHWNYALLLLLQGNYATGFREYEWRWKKRRFTSPVREFLEPRWDGGDPSGKTILVYAEQGFGDTIHFSRYLPLLVERGASVLFECHQPLTALMRELGSGITVLPFGQTLPAFDYHVPLLSLPYLFGSTFETIPVSVPYLAPPGDRLPFWKSVMPSGGGVKIGLCWAGKQYPDAGRTIPAGLLAPLAACQNILFVSLQLGDGVEKPAVPLNDLTMLVLDFADTAALIAQLDLVITIDTAVAHLAGALGKKTWLLLPFAPDWRWGLERGDCPWYPAMRLFRQQEAGDWGQVVAEVFSEFNRLICRH